MKRAFYFVILIALLTGCAKERDNYDTFLTSGTWTLSSSSSENKNVEVLDYVSALTPDKTTTTQSNFDAAENSFTSVVLNQTSYNPGATTFSRVTKKGTSSSSISFNKDGTYELSDARQDLTTQSDNELVLGPITNLTSYPSSSKRTGVWYWNNTTDTKQEIYMENLGVFKVSISKNSMELSYSKSNTLVNGSATVTQTTTDSQSAKLKFTK
jgi:hypothetical protein